MSTLEGGCDGSVDRMRAMPADVASKIRPETAALWEALRDVLDPEIPVSVVDLGLVCDIRRVDVEETWEVNWTASRISGCGRDEMKRYGITL